ncbi:hypothetical protein GI374_01270 [Paracoccus sp. S-4012]|uniref:YceI family protein n=1 Tax=Paracoccus sp. S-4012 TaxID=2665648 RepID=UPI0012AFC191|nr:YceI family protein [Paracoccus sp. S-4012]MRX49088.1 hypothetical protein [Paracoccus sp. S-4012]
MTRAGLILAAPLILATALPVFAQTAPAPGADATAPAAEAPATPAAEAPASADATAANAATADAAPADSGGLEMVEPGGTWEFDPEHSHVIWSYDHMGFSTSTGTIRGVTGTVTLDQDNPANSSVEASFPLSALKSVSALLDEHLMGDDFFAGAAPDTAITFRSTSVEPTGDKTAKVTGNVELNGVTQPLVLDVTLRQTAVDPVTQLPTAGFAATGTLLRTDFNLGAFAPAVSDEIKLVINVEAKKGS